VGASPTCQRQGTLFVVDALLDTSIVVDVLRNHPPALAWFEANDLRLGTTKFVWLEIMEGSISKAKQKIAIRLLNRFEVVPIDLSDIDWALQSLTMHILANSGLDMKDALIASTSQRLQVPLYTHNLKHMQTLLGDLAQKPY
jgi:predicted nucleic acid-binding protein